MQTVMLQGIFALLLLAMAYLARAETRTSLLYAWAIVVPASFGYFFWRAFERTETARREGAWTPQMDQREAKRTFGALGVTVLVWVAGSMLLFLLVP